MPETELQPYAYRIVRLVPNLAREEFVNLGVLLISPKLNRLEARFVSEESEFARIRRLYPEADLALLRNLEGEFTQRLAGFEQDIAGQVTKLEDTLANAIQLSPQRGLLTANAAEDLERIYAEYVAPPRHVRAAAGVELDSPAAIRRRANLVFAEAGVLRHMQPARAATFTGPGDTMRIDFHYRKNGSQGFAQALALGRDPSQAKAFAFTAERIRRKVANVQITAITEGEPQAQNQRHSFVTGLLEEQQVEIVPVGRLQPWASMLARTIH